MKEDQTDKHVHNSLARRTGQQDMTSACLFDTCGIEHEEVRKTGNAQKLTGSSKRLPMFDSYITSIPVATCTMLSSSGTHLGAVIQKNIYRELAWHVSCGGKSVAKALGCYRSSYNRMISRPGRYIYNHVVV